MKIETYEEGGRREIIWKMVTGTGGLWEIGQVNVTGMNIIITVEKAAGSTGFVALDELFLVDNVEKCETLPPEAAVDVTTTTAEHNNPDVEFECDFEESQCGWEVGSTNDPKYKWERISYDECTSQHDDCPEVFEPEANHYFMYVDGSKGSENDNTELMSPDNKDQGDCLMFEFNFRVSFFNKEILFLSLYIPEKTRVQFNED